MKFILPFGADLGSVLSIFSLTSLDLNWGYECAVCSVVDRKPDLGASEFGHIGARHSTTDEFDQDWLSTAYRWEVILIVGCAYEETF